MSLNIIAALELAADVAGRQPITQTLSDAQTLYTAYQGLQSGGKLDLAGMAKAGTLQPTVAALSRTSALLTTLLADKIQGPRALALLESLS